MTASIISNITEGHKTINQLNPPIVFEQFHDLPKTNQRLLGEPHPTGTVTPLALRPSGQHEDVQLHEVVHAVESLQRQGELTKKLAIHGVLLFRGLPIHGAEDFSKFAHAFGYKPHEIIGIVVDRPLLAPNVAPANESPKEVLIYNHNESPQVPHAPEYVFFYNHKAPAKGGETPVSSSLELFQRAKNEIPEFIQALTEKGILSRVTYKFDKQYTGGSTLKQAFGKDFLDGDSVTIKREKIEAQIARYGRGKHTTWEWIDDGVILTHRLPAIRTQPGTGLPTLFTGLAAYWKNSQGGQGARKEVTKQLYGDGTPIPDKYLEHLAKITDEIRVLHKWQQGDVLVFDNVIAQHGRQPWEGEQSDRVVLASLFDGDTVPGAYGDGDWAQAVQALDG
ncbi:taurine catabolism dioxygenase TauD [Colletotrichum scovillei]|uniref:Taurine catabolism dioxygenase TauD n=1 Tax=Colletotrichum scovillei TaxID=1209932 RepID=A0A9P7RIV2_9PEZI|nr:taurine catabolism dioxygenase TauD [Colletotrichum scovillei]KAF4779576.1 taurine catabolism dioxygenase TauD [Colletotrichum scovillei]KAG7057140.1 taurine catabolism dioxygenase TauD [Colletotrichum scovillei]KAG7075740.1 taurine catabolism dioxygenase TauD [Colletotrichum scovillei]KAG7082863.1 taurine catabolism dioxygenase TauD [Colletotrichum scovillei]